MKETEENTETEEKTYRSAQCVAHTVEENRKRAYISRKKKREKKAENYQSPMAF